MALALLAMVTVVAPIAGPILGGWITDNYSWPWIFFINVPIGIFASVVIAQPAARQGRADPASAHRLCRPDHPDHRRRRAAGGAGQGQRRGLVQLDVHHRHQHRVGDRRWPSFLIWELTDEDPIVDLKLFRHRNFTAGTLALVLAYAAFFAMSLLMPLWLQQQPGLHLHLGRLRHRADRACCRCC